MNGDADVAAAARLLAVPARAELALALMDGVSLPAGELAARAGIAPSTASGHLTRLVEGGLLATRRHGRHRYFRLAGPEVAHAVEALAAVAPQSPVRSLREATRGEQLRLARTCYDHLAGHLGVTVARSLERERALVRRDGTFVLGPNAGVLMRRLGIDLAGLERRPRPLVRGCLDWSERELHVAGGLGAAIAGRFLELGWIRRRDGNRSVEITPAGAAALDAELGIELGGAGLRSAVG
ncbi:MAG TPA: helix-turn-helix domain-containing protein [Gaiellaceae bacterium]|nr:helix-turn-helix domain-containing protein [Gaiellaceae bacterium]